jgi:hypothetical protein
MSYAFFSASNRGGQDVSERIRIAGGCGRQSRRPSRVFLNSRYARSQKHHALVFIRFAHDRRLVAVHFLFLFVFVLFVFNRISGRHGITMITKGLVENSSGMYGAMLLLLRCRELGFCLPDARDVIRSGWNGNPSPGLASSVKTGREEAAVLPDA